MKTKLRHGLDHAEPLDEQALDKVSAGNPFGIIVGAAASTLGLNGLGDKVEQIIGAGSEAATDAVGSVTGTSPILSRRKYQR